MIGGVVFPCLMLAFASDAFFLQPQQHTRLLIQTRNPHKLIHHVTPNGVPKRCTALFENLGDTSISDISTSELLAELDRRNIRYRPMASRQELEQLLKTGRADRRMSSGLQRDLAEIVKELVDAGIRLPPHASRANLERLLEEHRQGKIQTGRSLPRPKNRRKHKEIPRLLKELDDLGIRYPPGASPATLERLLRENQAQPDEAYRPPSRMPRGKEPQKSQPRQKYAYPNLSTSELLAKLNVCGIRFSPTATRTELEQLLRDHNRSSHDSSAVNENQDGNEKQKKSNKVYTEETTGVHISSVDAVEEDPVAMKRQRLQEGLKQKGVPYSPSSTYDELKKEWRDWQRSSETSLPTGSVTGKDSSVPRRPRHRTKKKMQSKRSYLSKLYGKSKKSVSSSLLETIPEYLYSTTDTARNRLLDVTERAARKARYYGRNVKDFFAEDDDGIRDADYYYVSKNNPIDVPAEPIFDARNQPATSYTRSSVQPSSTRSTRYDQRHASDWAQAYDERSVRFRTRKPRRRQRPTAPKTQYPNPSPAQNSRGKPIQPVTSSSATRSSLFQLPPSSEAKGNSKTTDTFQEPASTKSRSASVPKEKRTRRPIYSPYADDGTPAEAYRDSIDRFGELFANTAENILWGKLDNEVYRGSDNERAAAKKKARRKKDTSSIRSRLNWKDRLEERFDAMLGIHEDGEYYNRWTKQDELENEYEGENDAFSVAQGQAPKKSRRKKKKVYEKPFWEENNMISSLFGKSPPSDYSRLFDGGYLLPLCKTLIKAFILLATNACEWASVRGSLPQPVVVVGVTSCVVSARPGKRLLTLAVVLGVFRIVGELVHEAAHGNEDWEKDDEPNEGDMYDGADV